MESLRVDIIAFIKKVIIRGVDPLKKLSLTSDGLHERG